MLTPHGTRHPPPVETKATMFRGLCTVVAAHGLREQLLAHVGPETRALILDLPPATTWLDARHLIEVDQALLELRGPVVLRQLTRQAAELGLAPVLRGAAESLLRLFGASPASIFARTGRLTGTTSRGVEYRYSPTSETSGVLELEHVGMTRVPMGPLVATAGGLEYVFDLCRVKGSISDPVMVNNGLDNTCRYHIGWQPRR
jgi:hypothetical protein